MALIVNDGNSFPKKDVCFLCGEVINDNDIHVYWQGGDGSAIALHPVCAEYLGANLVNECLIYRTTILQRS